MDSVAKGFSGIGLNLFSKITNKGEEKYGSSSGSDAVGSIISFIILGFAIFLLMKCKNKNGSVSLTQVIAAICCSPCYIVYRLTNPC
jgi:hypothetical protein